MELQTISQVSRDYSISPRMLRYYEQVGLIQSKRKDNYAYRVYDEIAITRLRQIIVLRKLRVSVKDIVKILGNSNTAQIVEIFRQNINEIDEEITALSTVKSLLTRFAEELKEKADINLKLLDNSVLSVIDTLSFSDNKIIEAKENVSMEELGLKLDSANRRLNKIKDGDVRIIELPPSRIVAVKVDGMGCSGNALGAMERLISKSKLLKIKPDARCFGFDCLSPIAKKIDERAYDMWLTIPADFELPKFEKNNDGTYKITPDYNATFVEDEFKGGLYAAHVMREWDINCLDWEPLHDWLESSDQYEADWDSPRFSSLRTVRGQGFEELLHLGSLFQSGVETMSQLDMLYPIKPIVGELPHELKIPQGDYSDWDWPWPPIQGDWYFWRLKSRELRAATKMVVEYDGEFKEGYAFARYYPMPWTQFDNGSEYITEECGKITFDLSKTAGGLLGFAAWDGKTSKVKRVYLC